MWKCREHQSIGFIHYFMHFQHKYFWRSTLCAFSAADCGTHRKNKGFFSCEPADCRIALRSYEEAMQLNPLQNNLTTEAGNEQCVWMCITSNQNHSHQELPRGNSSVLTASMSLTQSHSTGGADILFPPLLRAVYIGSFKEQGWAPMTPRGSLFSYCGRNKIHINWKKAVTLQLQLSLHSTG